MAISNGTKFLVKDDLIQQVNDLVDTNSDFNTTSRKINTIVASAIESMWDRGVGTGVVQTTHAEIIDNIHSGSLVPGVIYEFEYENIYEVLGTGSLNTALIPNNPKETFLAFAVSDNEIDTRVISKDNPYDEIIYNIDSVPVLGSPTKGIVLERYCPIKNIKAPFDFRNYKVQRGTYDWAGMATSSGVRLYIFSDGINVLVSLGGALTIGAATGINVGDPLFNDTIILTGAAPYPFSTPATTSFVDSIHYDSCSDIDLMSAMDKRVSFYNSDIHIRESEGIRSLGRVSSASIVRGNGVELGDKIGSLVIASSGDLVVGGDLSGVTIHECFSGRIGAGISTSLLSGLMTFDVGGRISSSVFTSSTGKTLSPSSFIGKGALQDVIISGTNNEIGANCTSITNVNAKSFKISSECYEIHLADSTYSEIGDNCSLIDLINIGAGEAGEGGINNTKIGNNCSAITIAQGFSGLSKTTIGSKCSSLSFNGNVIETNIHPGTSNKIINPSPSSGSDVKINCLNSSVGQGVTSVTPDSLSGAYYWDTNNDLSTIV